MPVRYLSLEWIEALSAAAAASPDMQAAAAACSVHATNVVTGTPEGDVIYHLEAAGGRLSIGAGAAHPEDLRFTQDWDTAIGVSLGTLNVNDAIMQGRLRFEGDPEKLMANQAVFNALNPIFDELRTRTQYS